LIISLEIANLQETPLRVASTGGLATKYRHRDQMPSLTLLPAGLTARQMFLSQLSILVPAIRLTVEGSVHVLSFDWDQE